METDIDIKSYQPYILYVSSIADHKNHRRLIAAFNDLVKLTSKDYRLLLVGGWSHSRLFEGAKEEISNYGLEGRVIFLGRIEYELLPKIYRGADLFVFPSLLESFGHPSR